MSKGQQAIGQLALFDAWDEPRLLAACLALGARGVEGWSPEEERLAASLPHVSAERVEELARQIARGEDPLGELFTALRSPATRRPLGAVYTPPAIVEAMVGWAAARLRPRRVVDPGVGSARFLVAAGRRFPDALLVGVDVDPVATILARAHLASAGLAHRAVVRLSDYRAVDLPPAEGPTLFIGNPPYVRHHQIAPDGKAWLAREAARLGYRASQLAGLHVHFFLATLLKADRGDVGAFITSSEWLDVNYGRLVRQLLLNGLGGSRITLIDPAANPFPETAATGAVTYFSVGSRPREVEMARVASAAEIAEPPSIHAVGRERLLSEARWSHLTCPPRETRSGFVELGELCRVHRGAVTGANKVWIAGPHSRELPASVLRPSITRARELIGAGLALEDASSLRRVIDLPEELDALPAEEREVVERFIGYARSMDADKGYIARHRRAWWSVGLRRPAPILATYMARRPPAFVRNLAGAGHINIAHGLYPREELSERVLAGLVTHLARTVSVAEGRTYAGGLTKFEPREMERLLVPTPDALAAWDLGSGQGATAS